jgi:hypothetical protein
LGRTQDVPGREERHEAIAELVWLVESQLNQVGVMAGEAGIEEPS